jgi:hypothetical protein
VTGEALPAGAAGVTGEALPAGAAGVTGEALPAGSLRRRLGGEPVGR